MKEITEAQSLETLKKRLRRNKVFKYVTRIKTIERARPNMLGRYRVTFKKIPKKLSRYEMRIRIP